jgi:hypothetical protein
MPPVGRSQPPALALFGRRAQMRLAGTDVNRAIVRLEMLGELQAVSEVDSEDGRAGLRILPGRRRAR